MTRRLSRSQRRTAIVLVGLLACAAGRSGRAADPGKPAPVAVEAAAFFENKVRPILAANCFECHGEKEQKGGLRLDSLATLLEGGDRGPVVIPGQPDKSLLMKVVNYEHPKLKMPPKKKLAREQIADLTYWVKMGAPWPGSDKTVTTPKKAEFQITDRDRAHWAFQPVKRPVIPAVKEPCWPANPIDRFILARLEARGLRPNLQAGKRELIRRVTYDLTGLPPTPPQVEAFLADAAPTAYEALVDRLLERPQYGEKWGRHWLDLVRYAETNSYERDAPKPHAWRYRDYVLRSLNDDKPYDQFLREQLAGDELPQRSADALIATGYYRLGIWDDEPTDREQARYDGLDDLVATTGQVFLGLTLDCARCHNHKIDPIPQKDYYRFLAFFHNITPYHNGGPTDVAPLMAGPGSRTRAGGELALCVSETGSTAPETFVLLRGNPQLKSDRVEPAFPLVLGDPQAIIPPPPPGARSSGRRLVLANWMTSASNPLTARVMVNRIWQYHFGRGLVRSANNFGLHGDRPTHPELLDWLAAEFVRQGWRMKPLHRLMVTSSAYRMSSQGNEQALAADPTNDLLWRFDMRRLTAEEIRDSILAVTGTLNAKMYGPSMYPDMPREVLAGQSMPGHGWGKSSPQEQARRSVYIHLKRSLVTPILESFDAPESDRSTPVRFATTQPTQALAMLNSELLNKQAQLLAERLRREAGMDVSEQVRLALYLTTTRQPSAGQVQRGVELIQSLQTKDHLAADVALQYFCLMALNLNEFVYLD